MDRIAEDAQKFRRVLNDTMVAQALDVVEREREQFSEVFKNHLWDLEGPKSLERRRSREELYRMRLFRGFTEIDLTFEELRAHEIYVRSFPYRKQGLSRTRWLSHNIESFLHEVYILRERLLMYVTKVERAFKNSPDAEFAASTSDQLRDTIRTVLSQIAGVRGKHVHDERFSSEDLRRLATWEMVVGRDTGEADDEDREILHNIFEFEYRRIRKKWRERIAETNAQLERLVDVVFAGLSWFVLSKEGALKDPYV